MSDTGNSQGRSLRIAVVEDDPTVRAVLEILLNGSPGFTCAAAYSNGEDAVAGLAKGLLYKEIAGRLFIDVETVKTHIRHIYEKLQVHTRSEAIVKYLGK